MYQQTPYGSPLDPTRNPALGQLASVPTPVVPPLSIPAPQVQAVRPPLPTPPASVRPARINPFDKEHIAKSLWEISKGFAGAHSFGEGLAGAASGVAGSVIKEREAQKGTTEIGGPDNAFEIHTDQYGNRSFKRIAEVGDYLDEKKRRENAPKPKETAELIGDSLYAVEQLPEEQRPGAYQLLMQQAQASGHDVSWAPPEYSPTFSKAMVARTIGARQGSANEATRQYRSEVNADRDASRGIAERRANASIANSQAANARAAESHTRSMRKAPPSTRRGTSDLDYLK